MKRFRLSSDDNILFLQDINKNKDTYSTIFENPYLATYKRAHDEFGAKVHLNLFYEFIPDGRYFSSEREYFNLSMMTDKFRREFSANSDWLKLAFHANAEFPDKPYKDAAPEKLREDYLKVCREIERFAGRECISNTTTLHWGEATAEGVRELRRLGLRSLTGYFKKSNEGIPRVSYYFDADRLDLVADRDYYYDEYTDMNFVQIDIVLNEKTYEYNIEALENVIKDPKRGGFISMMIHEQYFYSDYKRHLPDFEKRVLDACKLLKENGYTGTHLKELVK
jgi:hypothetical protein